VTLHGHELIDMFRHPMEREQSLVAGRCEKGTLLALVFAASLLRAWLLHIECHVPLAFEAATPHRTLHTTHPAPHAQLARGIDHLSLPRSLSRSRSRSRSRWSQSQSG
jgi:hypothetical protein